MIVFLGKITYIFHMIRLSLPFLVVFFLSFQANAAEFLSGPVAARVIKIIDGDTVRVRIKIWLHQTLEVAVRLRGIDTPELKRPKCAHERKLAEQARLRLETLLGNHDVILHNISHDKYAGRVLAVIDNRAGLSVGQVLLTEAHARRYQPGLSKNFWCQQVTNDRDLENTPPALSSSS